MSSQRAYETAGVTPMPRRVPTAISVPQWPEEWVGTFADVENGDPQDEADESLDAGI